MARGLQRPLPATPSIAKHSLMLFALLAIAGLLALAGSSTGNPQPPVVRTRLRTSWAAPHLLLEALWVPASRAWLIDKDNWS